MPSTGETDITLQIDGRDVVVTHPSKLLIPHAKVRKLDLVNYYVAVAEGALRGAGGRPCVLVRYPDGIGGEFFFQKRAPAKRPDWLEVASIRFPSGRSADEVVPRHPADLAWMANLACLELHPHPVRADDLDHPDELARRPRSGARRRVAADPAGRARRPRGAGGRRAHRLAEDLRLARPARAGSDRAPLELRPGAARRAGAGARRRAPRARPRHQRLVEGGAPRRLRRLQPEREGPHRQLRLLGAAEARRARLDAGDLAGTGRLRSRPTSRCGRCRSAGRRSAIRMRRSMHRPDSLEPLLELSARHEAEGQGDAPWPPHYRKAAGEPKRAPPSSATRDSAADRDRARRPRSRRDRRRRGVEGEPSRRRPPTSSRPTCSSTACAAARRSGTACGST